MGIDSWFPTSIYFESLQRNNTSFNQELLAECYQIRDVDDEGRAWSKDHYVGGYTSYSSYCSLHRMSSTFMKLEQKISKHVKKFAEHLEMDLRNCEVEMTDCWVNIMPARTAHSSHIHPLSFISGTYYVQTPENCASIKFEDPRISSFMVAPPKKARCAKRNKTHVEYKPKAGKVVLFESWLRHEVPAAEAKDERISISFNYAWS